MSSPYQEVYKTVYEKVVEKLRVGLSPKLTYHSLGHTMDVLKQTQNIAKREKLTDPEDYFLLQMASLYHDTGFIHVYAGHEIKGCELARQELPEYGVTAAQLDKICGMIMSTKIPQSPANKLEEIICDADLDYLGRDDFEEISNHLYKEFLEFGYVKDYDDWMRKQVGFFEIHAYFTKSSHELRHPKKMEHLSKIKLYQPSGSSKT